MESGPGMCLIRLRCSHRIYKPNSVRLYVAVQAGRSFLWAVHRCAALATYPGILTSRAGTWTPGPHLAASPRLILSPYLVLLRVGFAMRRTLLSDRCALTAPFHPYPPFGRRYLFCGTFRRSALKRSSRTLSGTPLCGVRTFLPRLAQPRRSERKPCKSDRPIRRLALLL